MNVIPLFIRKIHHERRSPSGKDKMLGYLRTTVWMAFGIDLLLGGVRPTDHQSGIWRATLAVWRSIGGRWVWLGRSSSRRGGRSYPLVANIGEAGFIGYAPTRCREDPQAVDWSMKWWQDHPR
jgi:hypothetical protein